MKSKVLEIFKSVQGEGKYAGVSQVFVRFFECNMHCVWCDTPNSIGDGKREYSEYSVDELICEVEKLWEGCHSVSLTGGEPLLQEKFINAFAQKCKEKGMVTYLETNGILPEELRQVIGNIDIIAMDIKLPSSTKCRSFWKEHQEFLNISKQKEVFIKTVVTSDTEETEMEEAIKMIENAGREILCYVQPNYLEMKNGVMKKCLVFQEKGINRLKNIRILPQVHKFMKLR